MYARYYSRKENKLGVPYPKLSFFVFDVGKCCRKTFLIANAIEQFGSYCHQYDGFVASTFRYHIDWISVSCFLCVSFKFASTYRLVVFLPVCRRFDEYDSWENQHTNRSGLECILATFFVFVCVFPLVNNRVQPYHL